MSVQPSVEQIEAWNEELGLCIGCRALRWLTMEVAVHRPVAITGEALWQLTRDHESREHPAYYLWIGALITPKGRT